MNKQRLLVLGTGHISVDVADLAEDTGEYQVAGFVVDQPPYERGSTLHGKPVFWVDELEKFSPDYCAVCAVARMKKIQFIQHVSQFGIRFVNIVHPSARISRTVTLGEGTVINAGVQLAAYTTLGRFVLVGRGSLVGYDVHIGDYSVLSSGVILSCQVNIGNRSYIGLGARIIDKVSIGDQCFIGAGSLVNRNLPERVKVVGMPAMVVEQDIDDL